MLPSLVSSSRADCKIVFRLLLFMFGNTRENIASNFIMSSVPNVLDGNVFMHSNNKSLCVSALDAPEELAAVE